MIAKQSAEHLWEWGGENSSINDIKREVVLARSRIQKLQDEKAALKIEIIKLKGRFPVWWKD